MMYSVVFPFTIPLVLVGLAVASLFLKSILQYWRLRHIPGPLAAKFSGFWLARKFWNKEYFDDIALALDRQYGPVVSYGPNKVLFSDLSAVGVVFNTKNVLLKAESYEVAFQPVNGKLISSFATERNEARVTAMKRQIVGAFTTTAILDYECHVDRNIKNLISRLLANTDSELNIARWNIFFAFDTICNIAFSDDQGFMEKQSDLGNTLEGTRQRFEHWHNWQALPKLEKLIYKNRFAARGTSGTSLLGRLAVERLQTRLEKGGLGTHSDLLDRYLQASERDPATFDRSTIIGLLISTIHAGAETTAGAVNLTLYHLLTNPHTMARLRAEIEDAKLSSPPSWQSVSKLRYLEACIKEAGRMRPLILDPIEREVPPNGPGIEISGTYVPPGTVVAVNIHALNRDPSIWGDRVDEFRPERWIEADEAQLSKMERANLFFSAGRRVCIGQHIAWIEMKKFLPELLNRFDIELVNPEKEPEVVRSMVFFMDELMVRLTPRG
ncbi:uncharacterized protein Z520_05205 [Fonsecaea multimorphosa CBS 102226]|uniref:Pisatin demethylase n=1 Tax=Fonsecaea multimorphosa CBS 102226 TaxID=1442371 RepID=A0A0D2K6D1_9EURO|nr:uncharacterized protein Z520_05205 [Fonsecaea multimorphosa CBS 102226]KIX98744.1 hypothetical protein Z520_05205 [Fonsecaea multimorphosa CBS 102226]OAL25027.1 hypothetical protein AYO22_04904 [Fonsecaea multimorphosa]